MEEIDKEIRRCYIEQNWTIPILKRKTGLHYATIKKILNEGSRYSYLHNVKCKNSS